MALAQFLAVARKTAQTRIKPAKLANSPTARGSLGSHDKRFPPPIDHKPIRAELRISVPNIFAPQRAASVLSLRAKRFRGCAYSSPSTLARDAVRFVVPALSSFPREEP